MSSPRRSRSVLLGFLRFVAVVALGIALLIGGSWWTLAGWARSEFLALIQVFVELGLGIVALRALWIAYLEFEKASRRPEIAVRVERALRGLQFPHGDDGLGDPLTRRPPVGYTEQRRVRWPGVPVVPRHRWLFELYLTNQGSGIAKHLLVELEATPSMRPVGERRYSHTRVDLASDSEFSKQWRKVGAGEVAHRLQFIGGQEVVCFDGERDFRLGRFEVVSEGDCLVPEVAFHVTARAEAAGGPAEGWFHFDGIIESDASGGDVPPSRWRWRFPIEPDPSEPPPLGDELA